MTEDPPPGIFDIYQKDFYQPAQREAEAGRVLSLPEHLKAFDAFIAVGEGAKSNPLEVMRIIAANQITTGVAVFDITSRQQVGFGTLMARDRFHQDGRPMFDSSILIGSHFMRRGFSSLVLDYMKHYMAVYHPEGIWVLNSPQAAPQHMRASRETIRNSGATKLSSISRSTPYELWGQVVMPVEGGLPPTISAADVVFTHPKTGERRSLGLIHTPPEGQDF